MPMTETTTLGATNLRLYPGQFCSPIALGEQPATLITNQRYTDEQRTPGYVISRSEWATLTQQHPSSAPSKDQVQAYKVGKARDVLYPEILLPAVKDDVHTFIVSLGTEAASRSHREELDLLDDLDYDAEGDVYWSVVVVPTQWYEALTGAKASAQYHAGTGKAHADQGGAQ